MSLALWGFFWTEDDWLDNPAPPPDNIAAPGITDSGGGGSRDTPAPYDLWDVREAYLRSLFPEIPQPDIAPDNTAAIAEWEARKQQIEQLADERFRAIAALRLAADLATMKAQGSKIADLTSKIATLTHKQAFQNFMKH